VYARACVAPFWSTLGSECDSRYIAAVGLNRLTALTKLDGNEGIYN
jgi:hypothetical protein